MEVKSYTDLEQSKKIMAHLIDKDKVLSEIGRLDNLWNLSKGMRGQAFIENLRSFINNLEVINPYELRIETRYDK